MTKRLIPPTPLELAEHARALASAFNVRLIEDPAFNYQHGIAAQMEHPVTHEKLRAVIIRPITDEVSYAIALHELGHCIHPHGMELQDLLTKEQAAWDWAIYISLDWTPTMQHVMDIAFETHRVADAKQKEYAKRAEKRDEQQKDALKSFLRRLKL